MTSAAPPPMRHPPCSGVILAGGRGTRMSADGKGAVKSLVGFRGRPLIEWVIDRISPQVDDLSINCNDELHAHQRFGLPVIVDPDQSRAGPLAGMLAALRSVRHDWLVCVPCDSPFVASDLVSRLQSAALHHNTRLALASDGQRWQPVFALLHRSLASDLEQYLLAGDRKIDRWFQHHGPAVVEFQDSDAFLNFNSLAELHAHEQ